MSLRRVLLLAGSGQARDIAARLKDLPDCEVLASLAGVTRRPADLGVPTRTGGFGGAAAMADFLREGGYTHVIDATHPFAARISANASLAVRKAGLHRAMFLRGEWTPQGGDNWHYIKDLKDAANVIPEGTCVFLATGRQTLYAFENLAESRRLLCRIIDPPREEFPYQDGAFVIGQPPFSVEEEISLFQREKVDWLVTKNSGGAAARSKLDAARALGLPVLLQSRPEPPEGTILDRVEDVIAWLEATS